jgi:hypothetical protein
MTNYYIQQDDKIVIFDTDKEKLQTTLVFMPQYQGLEIQETERPIVLCDDCGAFEFADTDEYKEHQEQKRKEHIQSLTCTKRDFALILQKYGISYSQLKELIATNDNAQLEWDLCTGLLRSNPLLDLMAGQLNITSEQLDNLFLYANGELEELTPAEEQDSEAVVVGEDNSPTDINKPTTEENSEVAEENSDTDTEATEVDFGSKENI